MLKEIPSRYDHSREIDIYKGWEESGQFSPAGDGQPFSMVTPPPNVTGDLHLGHALTFAIEDTVARNRRRLGHKVLVIPGADHASIAVHNLVERKMREEKGVSRQQLGREEFLEEVWQWINHYTPRIQQSIRRFGLSADWSKWRFTMDEHSSLAVRTAFVRLHEQGLIYKSRAIINWDPKLQTTVSDDEIVHKEEKTPFYVFRFGPFNIGTARPETKVGDKYVVVHPDDQRYAEYKDGQTFETEWISGPVKITLIKDEAVDPEFGTGAMTITPAHDPVDFEIAKRHNLTYEPLIGLDNKLMANAGELAGLSVVEARAKVVQILTEKKLVVSVNPEYQHQVSTSDRGGGKIEPQILDQWFVKTTDLVKDARAAVKKGQIKFVPASTDKIYYHWLDNLHDWCVSRQLWWGHQIPVWYCRNDAKSQKPECSQPIVSIETPMRCPHCSGNRLEQDPDVLDTWFSSGLWPLTTLGWPNTEDPDFKAFFPTDLMETGTDIIFFWVSRMIMLSQALVGRVPFKTVFFHGLVLDKNGQKMSKSKGNTMEPLELIDKYGADALRLALVGDSSPSLPQKFTENRLLKYRNFVTKIWNASRFVVTTTGEPVKAGDKQDIKEEKFFKALDQLEANYQKLMDDYKLNLALEKLYEFFWHDFCDQFLEYEKGVLRDAPAERQLQARYCLQQALQRQLALLSDFAPYVTEAIKQDMLIADV